MEASAPKSWFLRKHVDGSVFGPLTFEQMAWADGAQIAPHDKISPDQETWLKAPMFPELGMDWLVEVTSERYSGPPPSVRCVNSSGWGKSVTKLS